MQRPSLCVWHELHNIVLTSSFWPWRIYLSSASLTVKKKKKGSFWDRKTLSAPRWKDGKSSRVWKLFRWFFNILDWAGLRRFRFPSRVSSSHEPTHRSPEPSLRTHLSHVVKWKQSRQPKKPLKLFIISLIFFARFHNYTKEKVKTDDWKIQKKGPRVKFCFCWKVWSRMVSVRRATSWRETGVFLRPLLLNYCDFTSS